MTGKNVYDLIVAGGGLSGVAAAVAAAREGVSVLLIERYGFLGGMATAGMVNPFMSYTVWTDRWTYDWDQKVNQGIFKELLEKLDELGGLHSNKATFNEELLKLVLNRLVRQNGIEVLLHSLISGVSAAQGIVKSVTVTNKSGSTVYEAKYFIDATGDADLSALAGCSFRLGREEDGLCQPMTLCFRLAGIDRSKFNQEDVRRSINEKYREFRANGQIKNPREDVLIFDHMVDDVLHFNSTRVVRKSAVDAKALTEAEMEAREQVYELYCFLKENIPGFERAQLLMSAPQIGVRESRRIVGEYTLTADDLIAATKFPDSVARGTYPVDIHNPSGSGTLLRDIPYGKYYTIPYRSLIPQGMKNLLVAGRPISSTHEAHSAYRVMPICCSMGEGAGVAVSIGLKEGIHLPDIDAVELHRLLDQYGALY
jgi:hypothetical protein